MQVFIPAFDRSILHKQMVCDFKTVWAW